MVIIVDDYLKPFHIEYDGTSYDICKTNMSVAQEFENLPAEQLNDSHYKMITKKVAYFSDFNKALGYIAKQKLSNKSGIVVLNAFIESYKKEVNELKKVCYGSKK